MLEWDEVKRQANLIKHGLDFQRALDVFDGRGVLTLQAKSDAEPRSISIASLEQIIVAVVWTWRGPKRRVISMRRARREERRAYRELFG